LRGLSPIRDGIEHNKTGRRHRRGFGALRRHSQKLFINQMDRRNFHEDCVMYNRPIASEILTTGRENLSPTRQVHAQPFEKKRRYH
jgi:hypothetical protein